MQAFISQFGGWLTLASAFVFGAIALYGIFDKTARGRRKDGDAVEDRVITLLQTEVTELTKRVTKQDEDIKNLTAKVTALETENHTLVQVLQGRDGQTQQFYKDAYVAMEKVSRTQDNVRTLHDEVAKLVAAVTMFVSQSGTPKSV